MSETITNGKAESGMVFLGSLLSWPALESWAMDKGYAEWLHRWCEPQWTAWLHYLLKHEPDDSAVFVHGKWATIQRIEELLDEAARQEVAGR